MSHERPMVTEVLDVRGLALSGEVALQPALELLRAGQTVVFPTDTVYGIGCDLWNAVAIERLFEAKQRTHDLAIPVLVAEARAVERVARQLPPMLAALAEVFWPGGLTLVLLRRPEVPSVLCNGGDTVAVRLPDHRVARALAEAMGGALAATSANLSGRPAPITAAEALAQLSGRVPLVLDGGPCPGGQASTLVDLVSQPPRLLRVGGVGADALRRYLPSLVSV